MKLRLPLLLRLALLSTAAAYTLGSGCLFADDAPADATEQDDPIAEAVEDDDAALMPTIGFEGYTESQLVDIQSSDAVGAVIHGVLENSTTGAVANVGTTSSTSNGATSAAESPALTLSAPAEPATDSALTTSTLSDSAGEGAVAPFFSAEEAAALVVASPATSTPSIKSASTATLTSSDASDETTSSAVANGAVSSSIASAGAGVSSGGGSASYSLTSSSSDSSSSSLVTTTPTDDTSSDPIAEEVLEDSTTEETSTTSTTLPDSSASTLAGTTTASSAATTRSLPQVKLLGSTESPIVTVDGTSMKSSDSPDDFVKGVQYREGNLGGNIKDVKILYLHSANEFPGVVNVAADSFYIVPANSDGDSFSIGTLTTSNANSTIIVQNNEWTGQTGWALDLTIETLKVNGSANLNINKTQTGALGVTIKSVENSLEDSGVPVLTEVKNSGTLTLGTNASVEGESKDTASSISIGTLENTGTMTLNGTTTITGLITNSGKLTNNGTLTLASGAVLNLEQFSQENVSAPSSSGKQTTQYTFTIADGSGSLRKEYGATLRFNGCDNLGNVTIQNHCRPIRGIRVA